MKIITRIIGRVHQYKWLARIFHTLDYCLQQELRDCESVLDLGCGPSSPLRHCPSIRYSVGVEPYQPYLDASRAKGIHTEYRNQKIEDLDFPPASFDAVIMIEVLEHLPEEVGYQILRKAEYWAKKKIVVSSPNGFLPQQEIDGNHLQKHLSGWDLQKMKQLGFSVRGLAGFKWLRQEAQTHTMGESLLVSMRFRPRFFWFIVATLSQIFTYYFPRAAFELFSVKKNLQP